MGKGHVDRTELSVPRFSSLLFRNSESFRFHKQSVKRLLSALSLGSIYRAEYIAINLHDIFDCRI